MRRRFTALLVVGTVAALPTLFVLGLYRASYGNWPWQGDPERLGWCDRVYNRGTDYRRWADAGRVHPAFRVPPLIGRQVYSDFRPEEIDRKRDADETCGLLLYLRSGDEYLTYSLSGGP